MKVKLMLTTMVLCVGTSLAHALPIMSDMGRPAHSQQQLVNPSVILRQGIDKLLAFLRQSEGPDAARLAFFLDREIAPYFDFAYMARWVAGSSYQGMTPRQRIRMEARLKRMFLGSMTENLADYRNQSVRFMRTRRGRGGEVTVSMGILQPGGYPSKIDFRFYLGRDGWKIFDVSANGNSALVYYRQYFNRMHGQRPVTPPLLYR